MRRGDRITYVDTHGKHHAATVTEVAGTGASGAKTLDVAYESGTQLNVAHKGDHASGEGYWLLESETPEPPERRAPPEKQPVKLTVAEAEGKLPEADRRKE